MDNLPLGPMLAVIALLVLWAGLFTAIEAAQQHLLALRPGTRQGDKAAARLNFPRDSLILCNTLCRGVVVILCTLLAIYAWAENGPWLGWLISCAVLLVLADYLPRALATRHPQAVLGFGNTLLGVPLKILYPLAWLLNGISLMLLRPFARKTGAVKKRRRAAARSR